MANDISKKEFLKRYLEIEEESSRKRKKKTIMKPKANISSLKIVSEDIDLKSMNFGEKADDDDEDEAPVVAEVIDERPEEIKLKELYDSTRWKKMNSSESSQPNLLDQQATASSVKKVANRRHDSDDDLSPLREQIKTGHSNISSPKSHKQTKKRRNSDSSDVSPSQNSKHRRSKTKFDTGISPSQSQKRNLNRHDSDSDLSPPRSQKQNRTKHNSDSDLSPPRNQRQNMSRHNSRHNSDSDLSPPRSHEISSAKRSSQSDLFDSQTSLNDKNFKNRRHDSDDDLPSLKEQNTHSNGNVSSSQRHRQNKHKRDSDSDLSPPRSNEVTSSKGRNKLDKTLSGLKAGLQNSKSLQEEVQELRKREKSHLTMLDDEISGKNADTIIRDRKTGKKRDLNREQEHKDKEDQKNKEYLQKYEKWGKGIETHDEHLEKLKNEIHEMTKPLARYEDDADLDERLKSIIHDDDPMSAYMKRKKQKETGTSNYPVYTGPPAPPNRFSIKPGYRWDGVDRSNGFEAKYFQKINQTKAMKDEAYLWSVQDM